MLISSACDNCGGWDREELARMPGMWFKEQTYALYRCIQCGHLFIDPRPDADTLQALYDADFFKARVEQIRSNLIPIHGTQPEHIRRLVPAKSKLLDLGCGLGDFIAHLSEYDCEGYETSQFAIEYCRQVGGQKIYGPDPYYLPSNYYDIVTAIEVLEHAFSPRAIFDLAYACLRPGGIFYYRTTPFDGWTPKSDWGWDYIQPEQHLNFFTTPVAEAYLKRAGFSKTFGCDGLLPLGVK